MDTESKKNVQDTEAQVCQDAAHFNAYCSVRSILFLSFGLDILVTYFSTDIKGELLTLTGDFKQCFHLILHLNSIESEAAWEGEVFIYTWTSQMITFKEKETEDWVSDITSAV